MGNIQTVGPNEALIVSGGCCRPSRKQIIVGGWCWNTFLLTNVQRISLQVMTLNPKCEHVQSLNGVPVTVTCVVHCKIMSDRQFLPLAAEQFLGKTTEQIKSVVLQTVEGHMRAVIGTQELGDICKKRKHLATLIREASSPDLLQMGIDVLSLTTKEIKDDVEYLSSAGKKAVARVKKDAAIEAAKAEQDAARVEAELEKKKEQQSLEYEAERAKLKNELEEKTVSQRTEVGETRAEAERTYDLELAHLQGEVRRKQMETECLEYEKRIDIQKLESDRRKTEYEMDFELPTATEVYEISKDNEAQEAKNRCEIEAEVFRITHEGKAKADATKLEGKAEADGLKVVAEARREFNEAAVLFEILKVLPEIAAELASPLTKFEDIVLISEGKSSIDGKINKTSDLARLASSVPMAIKAVGGSDKTSRGMLNSLIQLSKTTQPSSGKLISP